MEIRLLKRRQPAEEFETLSKGITRATIDGIRRSFEKSERYRRNQSKEES